MNADELMKRWELNAAHLVPSGSVSLGSVVALGWIVRHVFDSAYAQGYREGAEEGLKCGRINAINELKRDELAEEPL